MRKAMIILFTFFMVMVSACSTPNGGNEGEAQTTGRTDSNSNNQAKEEGMPVDETKDGKKTVVVSLLAADDFFLQAKQKYEAQHPNTTIEFKEFPAEGAMLSPAEVERYEKQTTTEVLSGKGADLYAVSVIPLPIEKYVNKKAFVNLDELIQKDTTFDPSLYEMNIIENSRMNDGIYTLPLEFGLEVLFGDAAIIENAGVTIDDKKWTWSEFAEISKELANKGGHSVSMDNWPPEQLLNNLVSDNYAKLVNGRTASFDSALFIDLLKQVKTLYDDHIITSEVIGGSQKTNFLHSRILSPSDYLVRLGLYYDNAKIFQKPHSADQPSGVSFSVTRELAMNANSTVKGEAWNFMKFLMSEEMQSSPQRTYISINKAVNDKAIQDVVEKGINDPKAGKVLEATEENLQPFKELVSEARLRNYGYDDEHNMFSKIIAEEAKAFFTGQKSAEATAELIQNRIMTYLNE